MNGGSLVSGAGPGSLESTLGRVLAIGTYASMALVVAGLLLLIGGGGSPLDPGPPLRLDALLPDLLAGRPAAFLWLGMLGIVATPAARVTGALLGYWRRGEWRMVLVAALILVVVAVGVLAGLVSG